jgi:hypothetical protein
MFDKEYLMEDIKDLLIDLEDQDFKVKIWPFVSLDGSIDDINIYIYKEENSRRFIDPLGNTTENLFNYEDIEYYINRVINYLKDYYKVKEESTLRSRSVMNPTTFIPILRTYFKIQFNKQD